MADKKTEKVTEKTTTKVTEPMLEKRNDAAASDEVLEPLSGDIDDRMAALLKDHQRMGARPK